MFLAYLFAVTVTDLTVVLGLVGATGSTTVCYILLGLFYFKLAQNERRLGESISKLQLAAGGMVLWGVLIMTLSLFNIIFGKSTEH
jgi:amino acid permease